jgi:transketolase
MQKKFELENGAKLSSEVFSDAAKKEPTRDGWGKALVAIGEKMQEVVVLTADVSPSVRTNWFEEKFPDRFIEIGIAEQNMASVAAGLAMEGKTVFFSSYGTFSPGRNWDQIRVSVVMNKLNVKFSGAHAGITVGPDGATHQALEDIALMRVLPGLVVLNPCDSIEAGKAAWAAAKMPGPVYIRLGRENSPIFTTDGTPFEVGKAVVMKDGADVAILATGILVHEALKAAKALSEEGIDAAVINHHTIKPLDEKSVLLYAGKCGAIVTAEEHQVTGGFGGAVSEVLSEKMPTPVVRVGMQDRWGESGPGYALIEKYSMDAKAIAKAAKEAIAKKKK